MVLGGPGLRRARALARHHHSWRRWRTDPSFVGPIPACETRPQMRVVIDKARRASGVSATEMNSPLWNVMGGLGHHHSSPNGENTT